MRGLVLAAIRFYKRYLWALFPSKCRYHPTCSEYAYRQVQKNGILRGGIAAVRRILSCHE
ncbi:membrane protein insertion efficiency factor YidD [Candidatus Microgenomates bacterium]|nr:membrane protein insertion efficiency factor YidD [Candidatus Microgenomates bacterium]